jgi:putative tryptophan/tyrosine transport system substrate-binding protein
MKTVLLLIGFVLASVHFAEAQQPNKIPRIGYIATADDINNPGLIVQAFQQGLRDLGYIEGKNIIVEYRYPGTEPERLPSYVAELIRLKSDVLVTSSTAAIRAVKETTKTIPVVMIATFDPVKAGMADSWLALVGI